MEEPGDLGASILMVRSIETRDILYINNPSRNELLFRLPGGKRKKGETPEEAASRETLEEAGVYVPPNRIIVKLKEKLFDHTRYFCVAAVPRIILIPGFVGSSGEIPRLFQAHQALYDQNFLRNHRNLTYMILQQIHWSPVHKGITIDT